MELNITLNEYLQNSLNSQQEYGDEAHKLKTLCRGWNYLKENITPELKEILAKKEYWDITYLANKSDYILNNLNLKNALSEEQHKQLESFVYVQNQIKRDAEELKRHNEREALAKSKGYTKTPHWNNEIPLNDNELDKIKEEQKKLDHKKVIGLFNLSKNGLLGSYNEWVEKEGTLIYSESYNGLMLMPKRHTRTGYIIRNYAYVKVLE